MRSAESVTDRLIAATPRAAVRPSQDVDCTASSRESSTVGRELDAGRADLSETADHADQHGCVPSSVAASLVDPLVQLIRSEPCMAERLLGTRRRRHRPVPGLLDRRAIRPRPLALHDPSSRPPSPPGRRSSDRQHQHTIRPITRPSAMQWRRIVCQMKRILCAENRLPPSASNYTTGPLDEDPASWAHANRINNDETAVSRRWHHRGRHRERSSHRTPTWRVSPDRNRRTGLRKWVIPTIVVLTVAVTVAVVLVVLYR